MADDQIQMPKMTHRARPSGMTGRRGCRIDMYLKHGYLGIKIGGDSHKPDP
jgi:hypothetical protein